MSSNKSPIVEKSIKHSVSPIRDVLVVPPGAVSETGSSDEESIRPHPALLVEQRTSQNTSPSPIVTSSASTKNNKIGTETGIETAKQPQSHKSHKSHISEKEKKKDKGKGKRKGTKRKGGGKTRKKYSRKLRTARGRKRQ